MRYMISSIYTWYCCLNYHSITLSPADHLHADDWRRCSRVGWFFGHCSRVIDDWRCCSRVGWFFGHCFRVIDDWRCCSRVDISRVDNNSVPLEVLDCIHQAAFLCIFHYCHTQKNHLLISYFFLWCWWNFFSPSPFLNHAFSTCGIWMMALLLVPDLVFTHFFHVLWSQGPVLVFISIYLSVNYTGPLVIVLFPIFPLPSGIY